MMPATQMVAMAAAVAIMAFILMLERLLACLML